MALGLIRRVFGLYPGEGLKALSFALIAFLSSFAVMGGATLLDGQFLEHLKPDALPLTYFWTAGVYFCIAGVLLWGLNRYSPRIVFSAIAVAISLFYATLAFLVSQPLHAHWWIFFKVVADAALLMTFTGLWTVVDRSYDLQDAKRIFGLFSGCLILGAAAGSGWVAFGLPLVGAGGIAASFCGAALVAALLVLRCGEKGATADEEVEGEVGWRSLLQQVLASRFTLYLLLFNILLGLIEVVCDFNYMSTLSTIFGGGEVSGAVTRFLGKARGWIYIGDMAFMVLLYGRMIKRIGVNNASLLSAGYFLALFAAGFSLNGLLIAVLGLIAVEGILPVLEDSNFTLLLNAVPKGVKTRCRVACEYFLQPVGMLTGSLLLALFQARAQYLGLGLGVAALAVAYSIRRRYARAIYDNLKEKRITFGLSVADTLKKGPSRRKQKAMAHLLKRMSSLPPGGQALAMECVIRLGAKSADLAAALEALGEEGLAKAMSLLRQIPVSDLLQGSSSHHKDLLFLAVRQGLRSDAIVKEHLLSDRPLRRAAAILTILATPSDTRRRVAYSLLQRLISSTNEQEVIAGLEVLGSLPSPRHLAILHQFIDHRTPLIAAAACQVTGRVKALSSHQLARLARRFSESSDPETRRACLEGLEGRLPSDQIETVIQGARRLCSVQKKQLVALITQVGPKAGPVLISLIKNPAKPSEERVYAARVLRHLRPACLETASLMEAEIERAAFAFYHYQTVVWEGDELTLIRDLLWDRYETSIKLAVHLICASSHDANLLCRALRSDDEKTHSEAVETLDKLCPGRLSERLLPLVDDRPIPNKTRRYVKQGGLVLTTAELIAHFHHSPNACEQIVARATSIQQSDELVELAQA